MIENVLFKTNVPAEMCYAVIAGGSRQCFYQKEPGSNYCILHGGKDVLEKKKVRNYNLQRYRQRVSELSDSEGIKSLREEIGIMRMMVEEILNMCDDTQDLLSYSQKITSMIGQIERLVNSCHKLESSLGFLLDKNTLLTISEQIINIINIHVKDELVIDDISEKIGQLIVES